MHVGVPTDYAGDFDLSSTSSPFEPLGRGLRRIGRQKAVPLLLSGSLGLVESNDGGAGGVVEVVLQSSYTSEVSRVAGCPVSWSAGAPLMAERGVLRVHPRCRAVRSVFQWAHPTWRRALHRRAVGLD